jgi:ribosomal protein S18 acetylase RimI-like enzyme
MRVQSKGGLEEMSNVRVRALDETDLGEVLAVDEKISGQYRPELWERRMTYYLRRDPDAALAAEVDGKFAGFAFGEVRSGEFGLEEPTGWIEVIGVDPDARGQAVGRGLGEALLAHFRAKGASVVRTLVDPTMSGLESYFVSLGFEPSPVRAFVKQLS